MVSREENEHLDQPFPFDYLTDPGSSSKNLSVLLSTLTSSNKKKKKWRLKSSGKSKGSFDIWSLTGNNCVPERGLSWNWGNF